LLLLGFSIYLAAELNFIHLPWLNGSNATPTIAVQQIAVPDLRGKTYQAALSAATKTGFTLKVTNGITTGVVINQDPAPPLLAPKGSSIRVTFASPTQKPTPTNTPAPKPTPTNTPVPKPTPTNTPIPKPTPTNTPPIPTITPTLKRT